MAFLFWFLPSLPLFVQMCIYIYIYTHPSVCLAHAISITACACTQHLRDCNCKEMYTLEFLSASSLLHLLDHPIESERWALMHVRLRIMRGSGSEYSMYTGDFRSLPLCIIINRLNYIYIYIEDFYRISASKN